MNENGFIKLHRSMLEWGWYKDPYVKSLFVHLLLRANYKDLNFEDKVIKRGQLVTSLRSLSNDLGMSDKTVRRCLDKLKKTKEIKVKSTNKYTLITICNYEQYQGVVTDTTQSTTQSTTQGTNKLRKYKNSKNSSYTDSDSKSHQPKKSKKDGDGGNMNIWTD